MRTGRPLRVPKAVTPLRKPTGRPKGSGVIDPDVRFWAKVDGPSALDCWQWAGARDRRGYGRFYRGDGSTISAHRYAFESLRSDVPEGLHLDHLCMNPSCVNPWHLDPVTPAVNTKRWSATVTHCPEGHAHTDARSKAKGCRQCDADRAYARRGSTAPRRKYSQTPGSDPFAG